MAESAAARRKEAPVKRSCYWESLEDALKGETTKALTASQLNRGRRYYSDGGARAVRLDDDTVHIEHRGIGRPQPSGVLPLHQLTPSRAAPTTGRERHRERKLANITNTAAASQSPAASTNEASSTAVSLEEDFSALASSRRVSFTPPRPPSQLLPELTLSPPQPIVRLTPARSVPDMDTLARQLAQQEEACRMLRSRLVTVERERTDERQLHDAAIRAQQTAHTRALQALEARHAERLALVSRRGDAVLWESVTDSVVGDTLSSALADAVDDAVHSRSNAARPAMTCALMQCDLHASDAARANAAEELAKNHATRIADLESQLERTGRELTLAVATRDALRQQCTDESVRSAALQEKLYTAEVALEALEKRLVSEGSHAQLQRQQFKDGMAAAQQQMTELLQQHEARVVKNMRKMGMQIDSWQSRLDAAEASLCVIQTSVTTESDEHAKSLAQLAEEYTSELGLVEASAAAAARFAQVRAEEQRESHASAEAALRVEMDVQLHAQEQHCARYRAVVADATERAMSTLEAQLKHAVAAEGELEHSVAARLAGVQAERDKALLFAEDVEQGRAEAALALTQAHQGALEAMRTALDTRLSTEGGSSTLSTEEEAELREELLRQRAAISHGDSLVRSLAEQVEVLLLTLERQQAAASSNLNSRFEGQQPAATVASTATISLGPDGCASSAVATEDVSDVSVAAVPQKALGAELVEHLGTRVEATGTSEATAPSSSSSSGAPHDTILEDHEGSRTEVGELRDVEAIGATRERERETDRDRETETGVAAAGKGAVAAPLPQPPRHFQQALHVPQPSVEPTSSSPYGAKLAAGSASLRRCNAKFQRLLEGKQRGGADRL